MTRKPEHEIRTPYRDPLSNKDAYPNPTTSNDKGGPENEVENSAKTGMEEILGKREIGRDEAEKKGQQDLNVNLGWRKEPYTSFRVS